MSAVKNFKSTRDSVVATTILVAGIMLASFGFANAEVSAPVVIPTETVQTSLGGAESESLFNVSSGVGVGSGTTGNGIGSGK